MGIASIISAAGGGILKPLTDLADDLFTTEEEKQAYRLKLLELEESGRLAQIAVNTAEAGHESVFVAGWRPAIGWVCATALVYAFIVQPFANWALIAFWPERELADLPALDTGPLMTLLLGMLGLAGMRTFEKRTGTNGNRR